MEKNCNDKTQQSERIVIFGASSHGVKVAHTFQNLNLEFEFFVDNDSKKWGKMLEGKLIQNPEVLRNSLVDYKIVIASIYHGEIEDQLLQMGIKQENIILKEHYIARYMDSHMDQFIHNPTPKEKCNENIRNILFDLEEGLKLGGAVKLSLTLSDTLYSRNKRVTLLTSEDHSRNTYDTKCEIKSLHLSFEDYIESVKQLVDEIINKLPCTVILNRIGMVFFAAYIVKKYYGKNIKIISILHSDFIRIYEHNKYFEDTIDAFICVSKEIEKNVTEFYNIDKKKVYFKDSPIQYECDFIKKYSDTGSPIIIGYGGRLEKAQKRADLLLPLIQSLEELNIDYILNIAGDGSYFNHLKEYIENNSLQNKMKLWGIIPYEVMPEFWKTCDIFVNLSDTEGCCLSMLEAMSYGVVPIVTDTSGTARFIENGRNGYICETHNVSHIAGYINLFYNNRNKLKKCGNISRQKIKTICNPQDYTALIENIILSKEGRTQNVPCNSDNACI